MIDLLFRTERMKRILLCEFVPIANKGEESILRGYEDIISKHGPVEITFFDRVPEPTRKGNLLALPVEWLQKIKPSSKWGRRLMVAKLSLGCRADLRNTFLPAAKERRPLRNAFEHCDLMLVGHDGYFDIDTTGILLYAKEAGKRAGIFGCGCAWRETRFRLSRPIVRRALKVADFCVVRERFTQALMMTALRDEEKVLCGPDPAFAMRECPASEAEAILGAEAIVVRARQQRRPIIGVTVVECGVVFDEVVFHGSRDEKVVAHATLMARVLDQVVSRTNALMVFLPHSIEPGKSDLPATHRIAGLMREKSLLVLEMDLPARVLKGIIGQCDFLLGERTHSLINSFAAHTPFVGFTNRYDLRTHGILGDMCGCEELLFDLDEYPVERAIGHTVGAVARRLELKQMLIQKDKSIQEHLDSLSTRFFT